LLLDIASYAVLLGCLYNLSHRNIEDLVYNQGITLNRETLYVKLAYPDFAMCTGE